ncbi:MAG: DsrE family protein [Prolixibacteraceae bacterium]|jgi:selenium metabolism protein YedF|nr:DsrE family protein [Prolixibacteraceae bacterium]
MSNFNNTLIQVVREGMGDGDQFLSMTLIASYFRILQEEGQLPRIIVFYNSGVKLLVEDSPVLEALKNLEANGVVLIACKTCLNHYGILDNIQVGKCGTMYDIIELQGKADKVITL